MKRILLFLFLLFAGLSNKSVYAQCSGFCGGFSSTGFCYCDDICWVFGDCCPDMCAACPGQGPNTIANCPPPPPPPPPPCGTPVTFNYTGGLQNYVIPPGVTSITVVANGAQGGGVGGANGGLGAQVTFTVPVTPGQTVQMDIGGAGGCPGAGYNGGGIGYNSTDGVAAYGSCGGGGATEVSIGGSLIAVASGGGGAGGGSDTFNGGGAGGCATGQAGVSTYGAGGGGGTQVSGGTGGAPWAGTPPGGQNGSFGQGGAGGLWQTASGGGGGGGYYGGGGGGNDGCCTGANGGGGGGGGSSLIPGGGNCVQGVQAGNGSVTIYIPTPNTMTSPNTASICSGSTVNIPLTSTIAGSTFTWVATSQPNVTGESTTTQTTSTLNNTLTNTTTSVQTVTYTVTPSFGGCTGTAQTVTVTVNPPPTMTSPNAVTICSGSNVNLALTASIPSNFSWVAASNANVTGESTTTQTGATINNTLTNTTGVNQTVVYTVTPSSNPGGCPGTPQIVNVTVTPAPTMTSTNAVTICSGATVNIPLTASTASTFTWVATSNANVTGESTTVQTTATLNNTLVNTTGVAQTVVYTVTPTSTPGGCPGTPQTVNVTVSPVPTMTSPNSASICSGATVNIPLTASTASTFTWIATANANVTGESTTIQTTSALNNTLVNTTSTAQVVVYTVTPTSTPGGCPGTAQTVNVTVNPTPTMTSPNAATICSGATVNIPLTASTASTFSWVATANANVTGESTTAQTTSTINNTLTNTTSVTQTVIYTVTPTSTPSGCPGAVQTVNVTVNPTPTMTSPNSATICSGGAVNIPLTATTASTFSWVATANANVTGESTTAQTTSTLNNTLVNTTAVVQTVTYTVTPTSTPGGCPGTPQAVTVTVNPNLVAGSDNAATLCNSPGSTINLNTLLSGNNATGVWAETTSSGQFTVGTGVFDASGLLAGTYLFTYTVTGIAPCPNDVANFTITVTDLPNAGADNSTTVCNSSGSTLTLSTLLSGADAGGVWAETSGTPSGQFTTGTSVLNVGLCNAGVYTFTYTLASVGPCPGDQAIMTVTINQVAIAGSDNNASLCNASGTTINMNTLLSGNNQTGVWAETTSSGQFNTGTGVFDASGLAVGTYNFTYTIAATAPCVPDVANFSVTVEQEALAGLDNTASLCNSSGTTLDLNTLLNGNNQTGVWAETSSSGQFNAVTGILDASNLTAGNYTFIYTVSAVSPCAADVANFTVTVQQNAIAGLDNSASLCNGAGTTLDLNTLVSGNNATGIWAETTSSGQFNAGSGILNAAGLAAGSYTFTYTVPAAAPCVADVADFTVNVAQEAIAGADNNATLCNMAGTTLDLNTLLSGNNQTGTWAETTSSGQFNPLTGIFNAGGLTAGNYSFTYTVNGVAPCVTDVANFTITVQQNAQAGLDNAISLCNSPGTTIDLNTLVSGNNAPGVWAETTASGQFNTSTGVFNAAGLPAGNYTFTYTVTAVAPCATDVANFMVTVSQSGTAGADNSTSLCNAPGTSINMNTLLSGNNMTGTWTETSASGQFIPGTGIFNAAGLAPGVYTFTYTVNPAAPCAPDVANFSVTVQQEALAGLDNNAALCNSSGTTLNLNTLLNGNNQTGSWTETTSSGQFNSTTGVFNAAGLAPGNYTFTYTVAATSPCTPDVANFTVTVSQEGIAGADNTASLCNYSGTTINLNTLLSGNNMSGTWAETSASGQFNPTTGIFNAGGLVGGNYTFTYTVSPSAPCGPDVANFTITVNEQPTVNFTGDSLSGCAPLVVNFDNLSTPIGNNCTWTFGDGAGQVGCGTVTNTYQTAGVFDVTLTVTTLAGCTASATYTDYVTVVAYPEAEFVYSPQQILVSDPVVDFTNSSLNADIYEWHFGDGVESVLENPTHTYPEIGNVDYTVMLIASNSIGCADTVETILTIQDELIFYVPNTFTPDGDDLNNIFLPIFTSGFDIYDYHLMIFNRWGEIMFESYNSTAGWNGSYGDQGLVEDGVYVWQIEFGDNTSDKRRKYRGHVTVLK